MEGYFLTNSSEKRCEPLRVGAAAGSNVKELEMWGRRSSGEGEPRCCG